MPRNPMFVLNAGAFVGSAISKAFYDVEADEGWEVTGTLSGDSTKPKWVKEVVEPTEEALTPVIARSRIIILDLVSDPRTSEKVLEILAANPPEDEKTLVAVSTIMTWSRTSPPEEEEEEEKALTEEEYKRRRPHVNFRDQLTLEKLVIRSKSENVVTRVVCAGLLYGGAEDLFHDLFKAAWHGKSLPLLSLADGSNHVPTLHIQDLCSVILRAAEGEGPPYMVAVDQAVKQTLKSITEAIAMALGNGVLEFPSKEDVAVHKDCDFFQIDLHVEPLSVAEMGIEWVAQSGLVRNIHKVVAEYRKARGIEPLKLLVVGPLAGVAGVLEHGVAEQLATEYKVPHITAQSLVAEAMTVESELSDKVRAAQTKADKDKKTGDGSLPDDIMAALLTNKLNSTECRNQGWVLDGYPQTLPQLKLMAPEKEDDEEEEAEEEDEGEEGAMPPKPAADLTPEHILVMRAPDATLKARVQAMSQPQVEASGMTQDQLQKRTQAFVQANAPEGPNNVLSHKALKELETLDLDVEGDPPMEPLLVQARIYLGKARNYGPTPAEVKAREERQAALKAEREAATAAEAERRAEEMRAERERLRQAELARQEELTRHEKDLLEARSVPLRSYLMAEVIPTLTEGLIEVTKVRPEDPVDYLAEWLFKNNPVLE